VEKAPGRLDGSEDGFRPLAETDIRTACQVDIISDVVFKLRGENNRPVAEVENDQTREGNERGKLDGRSEVEVMASQEINRPILVGCRIKKADVLLRASRPGGAEMLFDKPIGRAARAVVETGGDPAVTFFLLRAVFVEGVGNDPGGFHPEAGPS